MKGSKKLIRDTLLKLDGISDNDEWVDLVDNLFMPKCEQFGYCTEKKSCGRKDKKN